jgi:hypothetical protein
LVHGLLDVKCWCCELLDVGAKAVGNWSRGAGRYEGSTRKRLPELEAGAPQKSDVDKKRHVGVSEVEKDSTILFWFRYIKHLLSTCLLRIYFRNFQKTLTSSIELCYFNLDENSLFLKYQSPIKEGLSELVSVPL